MSAGDCPKRVGPIVVGYDNDGRGLETILTSHRDDDGKVHHDGWVAFLASQDVLDENPPAGG